MKRIGMCYLAALLMIFVALPLHAEDTNVALGANVQLKGAPFFIGGWGYGVTVEPSTIVDGVFLPQSNQWDQGGVWWDSWDGQDRWIEINLSSVYVIESLIAQVDDNDAYELYYWDIASNSWKLLWNVPNYNIYNGSDLWGMQTRPNPFDNNERYVVSSPIVTNALMLKGDMYNSDRLFSVSEIQAFGRPSTITVPVDIRPQSCPNPINVGSQGVLPIAILGTADFDVQKVDPDSIRIYDVASLRSAFSDVAAAYDPLAGKTGAEACTTAGPDGILDLTLKFDTQKVIRALEAALGRPPVNGEVINVPVTGYLQEVFGGYPIQGADVVIIINN